MSVHWAIWWEPFQPMMPLCLLVGVCFLISANRGCKVASGAGDSPLPVEEGPSRDRRLVIAVACALIHTTLVRAMQIHRAKITKST